MKTALGLGILAASYYAYVTRRRYRALCRDVGAHFAEAMLG